MRRVLILPALVLSACATPPPQGADAVAIKALIAVE